MLVYDDNKDLSSRAAGWISTNLRPALPGETLISNESTWDGTKFNLPISINYNNQLWMPPKDNSVVFYHTTQPVTLRVTTTELDQKSLQNILGENFTSLRPVESDYMLPNWRTQFFSANFFGIKKMISILIGNDQISLIIVGPESMEFSDIANFANGVTFNSLPKQVMGATTPDDTVRLAALVRPSVVMILNNFCSKVKFTDVPNLVLSGREYPFCIASVGSGFFVNKDGFIATNGHVVKNIPGSSMFYAVASGNLDLLLADYLQVYDAQRTGAIPARSEIELKIKDAHASKESIYQLAALVGDLYARKYLSLSNSENKYYIQLGNTPLQFTKTGVVVDAGIVEAKFIDSDYSEPDKDTGFSSSDVALLKVDGTNYPALPLGSVDSLSVGSSIQIIGFPGVVMGSNSFLLDSSANSEPTFTKGVVSAFKLAKGDRKKLIQTDASINHGNSGGPAISAEGNVVGIATYGLTPEEGGGNYNFLRDIQDLKSLMTKNNVSEDTGDTYKLWKSGLESYWLSYFQYAKNDFEKITTLYPSHPSVEKYLTVAKSKQKSTEDQTPKFTRQARSLYMSISVSVMALSLISIVIVWVIEQIDQKKKQALMV